MSVFAVIEPKEEYNRQNEAAFREEVRSLGNTTYDKRGNLTVPIGKKLQFTSPTGVVVTLGFDGGNFTIQQNTSTPVSMASISYVTTVETTLTSSIASLTVEVEAANDAAAAAATSASSAATSATAAGTSATAANTSATNASTSASNAATSASQSSTSETNAAGSASTATTQATNAANSATNAGNSATAASGSASTAATQATAAGNSATSAQNSATSAATEASNAATSAGAASTSAGNASTSASQASTSASNAAGSASSASTSATNAANSSTSAGNSATAASTSASQASTSATNAGDSASSASTSATNAANSATAAGGSASAAATSASSASTSATNAGNSATSSQSSSVTAASSAAQTYPGSFENDGYRYFTHAVAGTPGADLSTGTTVTVSGIGQVYQVTAYTEIYGKAYIAVGSGRTHKLLSKARTSTDGSTASAQYFAFACFDSSFAYLGMYGTNSDTNRTASEGWSDDGPTLTSAQIVGVYPTAVYIRTSATFVPGTGATMQLALMRYVDASETAAAAAQAAASATSASSASTSASGAATSASAASTSATTATTQASNASTSASQASTSAGNAATSASTATTQASNAAGSASTASTQASNASASATAASNSATLSATFASGSQGSINSSATFADNANATGVPTNWANWTNGSGTRVPGIAPQPYAFTLAGGAGAQAGISQFRAGALTKGFYVIEADVTLNSGAFTGAGVWVDWQVATVGAGAAVVFATDPDVTGAAVGAGTTGRLYRWRKLVEVQGVPDNGHTSIYAMSHWDGHGSIAAANSITWHRCAIRAASQAEIEARQAKNDLVTTNANVASNTSAIATETSARAAADTVLTARANSAYTAGQNLLQNSTFINGGTSWITTGSPAYNTGAQENSYISMSAALYQNAYQDVRVEVGRRYSLSAELYRSNVSMSARVVVLWLNEARNTDYGYGATINHPGGTGWASVKADLEGGNTGMIAPSGAAWARVYVDNYQPTTYPSGQETAIRRVCFNRGDYAEPWSEGPVEAALATTNATVATNTSAIATETSARTSADTTLTANFTALRSANDADSLPSTFEKDDLYWDTNASFVTESGIGRVFQATSGGHYIKTRGKIQVSLNRTYRITSRHRVKTNTTNGINPKPLTGIRGFDASGNTTGNGHWVGSFVQRTTSDGWITVSGQFTTAEILSLQTEVVSIEAYAEPNWSDLGTSNAVTQIQFLKLEDVTDIVTTNATITANQSAQAGVNSAQAATNSTLSAQVGGAASGSAINTSPSFADNANATGIPTNWYEWTNAAADGTRQTGIAPQPYAYQQAGRAGENGGVYQPMFGRFSAGWHVIEADITLVSGALTGAGVLLNADPGGVYTEYHLTFVTDADVNGTVIGAGTTGQLYKFRKLVQVGRGDTYNHIYAMSHYTAFGSTASANSIKFHRVAVRAASQAEIEARQAKIDLVTANANIATNASAIATETSARAAADTTLSAKINVNGNRFPHPQPLSTTLPAGWVGTGLEVGTWQPLGGNFYYRPRSSGGSATTEYYYYDVEPTASAWVSTGEQYTLSAVGYGGAGTAGDRLVMWLEYFNSGGTMVYQSPHVLLAAYAPPERYSTTAAYTSGGEYVRRRVVFAREWAASGSYQDTVFNYIKLERGPVATAYTADGALTPLQASVTTNASAIATVNGAAAFWETVVSAGGGDLSAVRLKAGSTGSYIELISTVLRLANVSNGAVIEVMRAISGEAFFSRPISSDSASRRLTIGPGYGVSGSEVVLWFGPVATAPSSQSRTNGYFALGTDGKIYFGSNDLAVLTTPMTATITGSVSTSHNTSVTPTVNTTVSVTGVTNATSPYTYQWALVGLDPGSVAPELTGVTASAVDVYRGATLATNADYGVYLSCTITDANGKQCVKHWSYVDVSTAS